MAVARTPYDDTEVSVSSSQREIRKALVAADVDSIWFIDEFNPERTIGVRFVWKGQGIRFTAHPYPEQPDRGKIGSAAQKERQAWRAVAWYVTTMLKAARFGMFDVTAVFAGFYELPNGSVVVDNLRPLIESGQLQLKSGDE